MLRELATSLSLVFDVVYILISIIVTLRGNLKNACRSPFLFYIIDILFQHWFSKIWFALHPNSNSNSVSPISFFIFLFSFSLFDISSSHRHAVPTAIVIFPSGALLSAASITRDISWARSAPSRHEIDCAPTRHPCCIDEARCPW